MNTSIEILTDDSKFPSFLREAYAFESCLKWNRTESTWLCRVREQEKQVLIKVAEEETAAQCLRNEYAFLQTIARSSLSAADTFPQAIRLFSPGEKPRAVVLVREYIPGHTLESLVESQSSRPGLSRETAVRHIMEVLDLLDFLHHLRPPVIHRDIKPQNIIVDPGGRCHLIDLGAARSQRNSADVDTVIMGTRLVAPPEQYGYRPTDERSDIYSVGVLLRFCLTGEYEETADAELPPDLRRIVQKATRFDPKDRFSGVTAFRKSVKVAQRVYLSQPKGQARRVWGCALTCVLFLGLGFLLGRLCLPSPELSARQRTGVQEKEAVRSAVDSETPKEFRITEAMFDGDQALYEAWQQGDFSECTAAILPDGLHIVRYLSFVDRLADLEGRPADRIPLSAEELSVYLTALQKYPLLWTSCLGFNLLFVRRDLESLEPFRVKYLTNMFIALEFHNCSLPSDPSPLEAVIPYCTDLACYGGTTVSWNHLDFLQHANRLSILDLTFDGSPEASFSGLALTNTLRILRLTNASLDQSAVEAIGRMSELEVLSLINCDLTDISPLSSLTQLTELNLNLNRITDLSPVENLPNLQSLSAEEND